MPGLGIDLTRRGLEHALSMNKVIENCGDKGKELAKKLRSRARDLPSLVLESGLVPALLFYLSKTSPEDYRASYGALANKDYSGLCSSERGAHGADEHEKKGPSIDKISYSLITAGIIIVLRELGYLDGALNDVRKTIQAIIDLREKRKEFEASMIVQEYLVSLKRAAEALWEGED